MGHHPLPHNGFAIQNVFNGTWYCYKVFDVTGAAMTGTMLITANHCNVLWSGSSVIKILHNQEYSYVKSLDDTHYVYLGLARQLAWSDFTWYDGSVATGLPWAAGRPDNSLGVNSLVYVNADYTIMDSSSINLQVLVCRKPATFTDYDWASRFW